MLKSRIESKSGNNKNWKASPELFDATIRSFGTDDRPSTGLCLVNDGEPNCQLPLSHPRRGIQGGIRRLFGRATSYSFLPFPLEVNLSACFISWRGVQTRVLILPSTPLWLCQTKYYCLARLYMVKLTFTHHQG